jgi:hypothetical protein
MRARLSKFKVPLLIWLFSSAVLTVGTAQNIVVNGSFEFFNGTVPPPPWNGPFGMFLGINGAADGRNFASVSSTGDYAAQMLLTTPGQTYHLSFAVSGNSAFPGNSVALFKWGGAVAGTTTWIRPNTSGDGSHYNWIYGNFDLLATTSNTE